MLVGVAPDPLGVWVEANEAGHAIVFALDVPGTSGKGASLEAAIDGLRRDLDRMNRWLACHGAEPAGTRRLTIVQTVPATGDPLHGDTEGFFDRDAVAFTDADLRSTRCFLAWSRTDLLSRLAPPGDALLDVRTEPGTRTIREIVDHVAIAEWWYTTRILEDPSRAPDWRDYGRDPFERLRRVRQMVEDEYLVHLQAVPAAERERQYIHHGEVWTAAKTLRRAVWHELYHLKQIERMLDSGARP